MKEEKKQEKEKKEKKEEKKKNKLELESISRKENHPKQK